MTLTFTRPTEERTLNVLLYGPPKSWKTTGACSAPGKLLLVRADRPNATRFAHELYGERIQEVEMEGLQTLVDVAQAAEQFDSVVLDPVQDVYRVLLESLTNRALSPALAKRGDANTYLERFCREMCDKPVNFVMVAHEQRVKNEETGAVETTPYVTSQSGSPVFAAGLMKMADVYGFTGVLRDEESGERRGMVQLVDGSGRMGGSRYEEALGSYQEVDIARWITLIASKPTSTKEDG